MAQNWSFIAASSAVATGANPAPAIPAGRAAGDLLLIVASSGAAFSATPPTGFAELARNTSASPFLVVWGKTATGSETAGTVTNSNTTSKAGMLCYRGVTLLDIAGALATGSTTATSTTAALTTAADDLVLNLYGGGVTASATGTWSGGSANSRINSGTSTTLGGIFCTDENQAAVANTTSRTGTLSRASTGTQGITLAFKQNVVASLADTDAADVAAVAASVTTGSAVIAKDAADTTTVATIVTTGGAIIVDADGPDVAAIAADVNLATSANIAATDAGDSAALIATVSAVTSATIATTDAADQAIIAAANWTTALLASIDAADIAAIEASGGAATQRFVPGHKHEGGEYQLPRRRYRTEEEIRQRRIELGIIPAPVEKVVAKAARRVIAKAQAQARADSAQDFDALAYLQEHQAQQRANLAADLRKRQIQAGLDEQRTYMILLSIETEAQVAQMREEEQILTLLMEM